MHSRSFYQMTGSKYVAFEAVFQNFYRRTVWSYGSFFERFQQARVSFKWTTDGSFLPRAIALFQRELPFLQNISKTLAGLKKIG